LKGTARWRPFAASTAAFTHTIVEKLKPKPRRKPAREAPEPTAESGD